MEGGAQAKPTPPVPEAESAITHLECALKGDRYEKGVLQGLSKAMKPLLVKYDYEKAKKTLTRESLAARPNTMWCVVACVHVGRLSMGALHAPTPTHGEGRSI